MIQWEHLSPPFSSQETLSCLGTGSRHHWAPGKHRYYRESWKWSHDLLVMSYVAGRPQQPSLPITLKMQSHSILWWASYFNTVLYLGVLYIAPSYPVCWKQTGSFPQAFLSILPAPIAFSATTIILEEETCYPVAFTWGKFKVVVYAHCSTLVMFFSRYLLKWALYLILHLIQLD